MFRRCNRRGWESRFRTFVPFRVCRAWCRDWFGGSGVWGLRCDMENRLVCDHGVLAMRQRRDGWFTAGWLGFDACRSRRGVLSDRYSRGGGGIMN